MLPDPKQLWLAWEVGSRIMVRHTIDDPTHKFTDVLGHVLENGAEGVLLRTRRGDVFVPGDRIVVGKPIPPAPPRRRARRQEPSEE